MWKSRAFFPWPSMSICTNRSPSFSAALRNSVGTDFCEAPKKNGTRTPAGTGLGAEDERVVRLELRVAVGAAAAGLDAEEARALQGFETGGEARVHPHRRELLVVEAGAAHRFAGELEAERLHQVQRRAAVGAQADDVAGIGRDFGLKQHDVEHGFGRA